MMVCWNQSQELWRLKYLQELFKYPSQSFPLLPDPWITHIHFSLSKIQGSILILCDITWPLQQENNWFIMDLVMANNTYTIQEIQSINRRNLQCVMAHDMTKDAGMHILPDISLMVPILYKELIIIENFLIKQNHLLKLGEVGKNFGGHTLFHELTIFVTAICITHT